MGIYNFESILKNSFLDIFGGYMENGDFSKATRVIAAFKKPYKGMKNVTGTFLRIKELQL